MQDTTETTLESECAALERACDLMADALKRATRAERALHKAAVEGDLSRIRRLAEELALHASALADATRNAAGTWSWTPEREVAYLEGGYAQELISTGAAAGLRIDSIDSRLTAFPALLKVLAAQRTVRIDTTKIVTLRPSRVVARLKALQQAKPRLNPERFLEVIFDAYARIVPADNISAGARLQDVYDLLTVHPDMRRQYDKNEFARDVHLLDRSGVGRTKSGHEIRFPAATGTKSQSGTFTIVDAAGTAHTYYAVRFQEAPQ